MGDAFPREVSGLPEALPPLVPSPAPRNLVRAPHCTVAKRIGDATVRMLAYNGSVPGPTLMVRQGSRVTIDVINDGDIEATVHWHGLRLDNRYAKRKPRSRSRSATSVSRTASGGRDALGSLGSLRTLGASTAQPALRSTRRSSCAFAATMTVLSDISTAANAGASSTPRLASTPAARGIAKIL